MIRRYSPCHWSQKINWGLYQSPTLVVWPFMAFLGLEDQPKIDRFLVYFKSLKHSSLDMSAPWSRGLRRWYVGYASSHGFKTRLNRIFGIFFFKMKHSAFIWTQGLHQVKKFQNFLRSTIQARGSKFYLVSYLVAISVNQNVAQKIHEGVGLAT